MQTNSLVSMFDEAKEITKDKTVITIATGESKNGGGKRSVYIVESMGEGVLDVHIVKKTHSSETDKTEQNSASEFESEQISSDSSKQEILSKCGFNVNSVISMTKSIAKAIIDPSVFNTLTLGAEVINCLAKELGAIDSCQDGSSGDTCVENDYANTICCIL